MTVAGETSRAMVSPRFEVFRPCHHVVVVFPLSVVCCQRPPVVLSSRSPVVSQSYAPIVAAPVTPLHPVAGSVAGPASRKTNGTKGCNACSTSNPPKAPITKVRTASELFTLHSSVPTRADGVKAEVPIAYRVVTRCPGLHDTTSRRVVLDMRSASVNISVNSRKVSYENPFLTYLPYRLPRVTHRARASGSAAHHLSCGFY